jgi:hypothetical protein
LVGCVGVRRSTEINLHGFGVCSRKIYTFFFVYPEITPLFSTQRLAHAPAYEKLRIKERRSGGLHEATCYAPLDVSAALQENPVETTNQDILRWRMP